MKKRPVVAFLCIFVLLAAVVVFFVIWFAKKDEMQESESVTFSAFVLEIHDAFLLVEPALGSQELNSSDKIEVPLRDVTLPEGTKVGDMIEIDHDGMIMETYPARLSKVYSIRMADTIDFNEMIINRSDLSEEALVWLEQYNCMSELEKLSISYVPQELIELNIAYYERNPIQVPESED